MSNIMIYATKRDADAIREWINGEPDIAWIVKISEQDGTRYWKAVNAIDSVEERSYALWHIRSGRLNIPSGTPHIPDGIVADPFAGWSERTEQGGATTRPWFGGNLPGPYSFKFKETGREATGSLGRSEFFWFADRYRIIGKPAHPEARRWWERLRRFVKKSSVQTPWVDIPNVKSPNAYIFPDAKLQIDQGRHRDVNP